MTMQPQYICSACRTPVSDLMAMSCPTCGADFTVLSPSPGELPVYSTPPVRASQPALTVRRAGRAAGRHPSLASRRTSRMQRMFASILVVWTAVGCSGSQLAGTAAAGSTNVPTDTPSGPPAAGASQGVPVPSEATAANVQVVGWSSVARKRSSGGGTVQIIVTVKNEGGGIAELGGTNSESWTLSANDGSVLDTGDLTPAPQFLAPGDSGYLVGWTDIRDNATFAKIGTQDQSVTFSAADTVPAPTLTTAHVTARPDSSGVWMKATGTVTNVGTANITLGTIIVVLLDASGEPVGFVQDSASVLGMLPNQTKGFSTDYGFAPAFLAPKVKSIKVYAYELQL